MTNSKLEQVRYYLERLYKRTRYGKSTDTKPTDAEVGDKYIEVDTNKEYYFYDDTWNEISTGA
jgi:hypothetical protein